MMQPNPRKTTSIRRLGTVEIEPLKNAVLALPDEVWDAENASKPNRFGALDATRHIIFRFVSNFRDWRQSYDRPHKIHVPILTNQNVSFYVDGVRYQFAEGEAVEVNNMGLHAVENRGLTDRIHLIFEYYDLDQAEPVWLANLAP